MRVLVTGADGFAGRYLLRQLLGGGHAVLGAVRRGAEAPRGWLTPAEGRAVDWTELELTDPASCRAIAGERVDAVVHLAAIASSRDARQDPAAAWAVNAGGTALFLDALAEARAGGEGPLVLAISSGEVYGAGPARPRVESEEMRPQSPYAATKAAMEIAALEVWRRTGLRVVIARAFQHIGPGQAAHYVVPSLLRRIREARAAGERTVATGNLEPVRDITDVRDVVAAYAALLERGVPGTVYNVAQGEGIGLGELFARLASLVGAEVTARPDPGLVRAGDIPHLVGSNARLREATGWRPAFSIDQTLRDMVDAQAD